MACVGGNSAGCSGHRLKHLPNVQSTNLHTGAKAPWLSGCFDVRDQIQRCSNRFQGGCDVCLQLGSI
jgi:hypothetical protein